MGDQPVDPYINAVILRQRRISLIVASRPGKTKTRGFAQRDRWLWMTKFLRNFTDLQCEHQAIIWRCLLDSKPGGFDRSTGYCP
jgi:hypothetical protein